MKPFISDVERAYREYEFQSKSFVDICGEEDRLHAALDALDGKIKSASRGVHGARLKLMKAIMQADPRPLPEVNEWSSCLRPHWQVRSGDRVFALVPSYGANIPDDHEEALESVSLAIVELEVTPR